ncbi:MAG: GNAT family N-acetyltransferase [Clostridia bacterium]|nr:GNAT family N-acetyltransferase [Clostridia bacterium]
MKIVEVNNRTSILINQLLEVWENSVKATHLFLSNEEIENIKKYIPQAISDISHLIIAKNDNNTPIAFMGIENEKLEMLFIRNNERGKGLGKKLLNYGIENYNINELVVNEQNPNAEGFYEHIGFKVYKRSEFDEQGNSYPILYMRLER